MVPYDASDHFEQIFLLYLSLTTSSPSEDHQALGWRLKQLKGMEDLVAFNVREVRRAAAEERKRDEYSSAERQ